MRAVGMLLLVFGAVAVTFIVYWSKRAISASKDAAALYKETGSFADTAKLLYHQQSQPDKFRLSHAQFEHLRQHADDFWRLHRELCAEYAWRLLQVHVQRRLNEGRPVTKAEEPELIDSARRVAADYYGKIWCESRGIH